MADVIIEVTEEEAIIIETPATQGATGPTGDTGETGTAGTLWYSGAGVPSDAIGVVNDMYLNNTDGTIYKKGAVSWAIELDDIWTAHPTTDGTSHSQVVDNTNDITNVSGTVDTNTTAIGLNTTHRTTVSGNPHEVKSTEVQLECLNCGVEGKSVERWFDHTQATGYFGGGEFTDNGDQTITVGAGDGVIKATDVVDAENMFFLWDEDVSVSTVAGTNYIYVAYDATTPTVESSTTKPTDVRTNVLLGKVFRDGTELHLFKAGMYIPELGKNVLSRFVAEGGEITRTSGGVISETGTLNIASTSATVWGGLTKTTTSGIDTSGSDTFTYCYYNFTTSDWVKTDEQVIDSANYNDITTGTGLDTISFNRYGVHWVYVDADGHIIVVYGQASYRLADAQDAQPPSLLPTQVTDFSWLAGKVVVYKNASVFTELQSAYDISFISSTATDHKDLGGLQGGQADQYYHLNSTNYTDLTDAGDSDLHYHATDRDRANHTGTQTASTISDFDTEVSNNTAVLGNTTYITSVSGTLQDKIDDLYESSYVALTPVTDTAGNFATVFSGINLYGGTFVATASGIAQLPVMVAGMNFTVITLGDIEVSINTNVANGYLADGVTVSGSANITNLSTTGDMAVIQYYTPDDWLITTNGWTI